MANPTNVNASISSGAAAYIGVAAPPPAPAPSLTLSYDGAATVGVAEAVTVAAANITGPVAVTVARVSGPAATIDPVPVTPEPGSLTKIAYATAAAIGTLRLQASATIGGSLVQSNQLDLNVAAASPPPSAATTATLSFPSTGVNGFDVTLLITLNGPAPTGGVTFTLSGTGATFGSTTVNIGAGSTSGSTTLRRAATGSSAISYSSGSGLTLLGNGQTYTTEPAASSTPFKVVRTGLRYATLELAVAGAIDFDTIEVAPGTYVIPGNVSASTTPGMTNWGPDYQGIDIPNLTIQWEVPGVMPVIDLSAYAKWAGNSGGRPVGIAAGSNNRSLVVRGLRLIGHPAGDSYGINTLQGYLPGVGFNGNPASTLTVDQCVLERWADGIKSTIYNTNITVNATTSVIKDCTANFLTHGIYVSNIAALNVRGCTFLTSYRQMQVTLTGALSAGQAITSSGFGSGVVISVGGGLVTYRLNSGSFEIGDQVRVGGVSQGTVATKPDIGMEPAANNAGHLIKSRARVTVVEGCKFDAPAGCASCIETPSGGTLRAKGNIILHYGQPSSSDDNPAIKYGFEETARRMTLSVSGTMPTVGQQVTNGSMVANVYAVGSNWIVYNVTTGTGLYAVGATISLVGGSTIGTVTSSIGSPDGSSQDGRTHLIEVAQNTIRKLQPGNWSGSTGTAIAAMWVSANMTLDDGTPLLPSSIPTTFRNCIVGDKGCGDKTVADYPNNTVAESWQITDEGKFTLGIVNGSPAAAEAAWSYAGQLIAAIARIDDKRGGRALRVPAYLSGKTQLQWFEVGSADIVGTTGVDPTIDPAINPNIGQPDPRAPWAKLQNLGTLCGYSGGTYLDATGRVVLGGGGHAGYLGNEQYEQDLMADLPTWKRRNYPGGSIQLPITFSGNLPVDGPNADSHSDGRPKSVHSYDILCQVPNGDVIQAPGGATDNIGTGGGWSKRVFINRRSKGDWDANGGVLDTDAPPNRSMTCYDPKRHVVWCFQGMRVTTINPDTGVSTYKCTFPSGAPSQGGAIMDVDRDLIYLFQGYPGQLAQIYVFDPNTNFATLPNGGWYTPPIATISGTRPTNDSGCGVTWDRRRSRLLSWDGYQSVWQYAFPTSGGATGTWAASSLSVGGVTPYQVNNNGMFGRFFVSEENNAAYGIPASDKPTYCLPLEPA